MKFFRVFTTLVIISAMVAFTSGCDDDDELVNNEEPDNPVATESISLSPTSLFFEVEGGTQTISVFANASWSVDGPDWVSVSPSSGSADSDVMITVASIYSDDGSEARDGTLTFSLTSGKGEACASITQQGNGSVSEEPEPEPEPEQDGLYFSDDFEWLDPWSEVGGSSGGQQDSPAGDTVNQNDQGAYCPQLATPKVDGVSALQALLDRGYDFIENEEGSIVYANITHAYLQRNYLKFGKTGCQVGIYLPLIYGVSSDASVVLAFDWCPMETSSLNPDTVNLLVEVTNSSGTVQIQIPTHDWVKGQVFEWIPATVNITEDYGVKVTDGTEILIYQEEWGVSTANRWFLDNIKIYDSNIYDPAQ